MANRKSKMTKQRNHTMQLEKLEARQLLATVTGGGEEVGTDISFQGNTYDQILMTGASVTVEADAGQVVRVSAVDINDDIVQFEFSGAGQFSVSLDDFEAAAAPVNYNQPGVEYVKGRASITIEGSDSSTNVSVSTVGSVTSPVFGDLDNGATLDGVADIARITIVADPTQPGGSTFGGIRTANARFADDSGIVGITAAAVNVQSVVIMGDINASDTGVPTLLFGAASQFGTLQVAGGDLAQDNGVAINDLGLGGFQSVNFIDGTTSAGVLQPADVFGGAFGAGGYAVATLDTTETINIDGLNQSELDTIFLGKTFTNSVNVVGDLALQNTISVAEFRQNVTFDGVYDGAITVGANGVGGDMSFLGVATDADAAAGAGDRAITSAITIGGALTGSLTFGASSADADTDAVNYSGNFTAASTTGSINVFGAFSGLLSTDTNGNSTFDAGEGALGNIGVLGDFTGRAIGILGIGDVTVGGDLTGITGVTKFHTSSGTTGDSFLANMGSLTVTGDTNITDNGRLIDINANGNFGDIILHGGGTAVGLVVTSGVLGGTTTGAISITGEAASGVTVHGFDLNSGTLGNFTVTGDGTTGTAFALNDAAGTGMTSTAGAFNLSDVTVSGFDVITLTDAIAPGAASTAGNFSFDANAGAAGTAFNATGAITILATSGTFTATSLANTVTGGITATTSSGAITFNGATAINGDITSITIGAFKVDGDATFADGVGIISTGTLESFEVTGDTVFNSTAGSNLTLGDAGTFTFGGDVTMSASTDGAIPSIIGDDGTSALDVLGDFTFGGRVIGDSAGVDIQASSIGNITIQPSLTAAGQAVVLDLNVKAVPNEDAVALSGETVLIDGSDLGNYSIGNITVTNTNTIGVTGTVLFDTTAAASGNSFIALGAIGDITLSAGGSENVQTGMFSAVTDSALFIVGDIIGAPEALVAALDIDLDGTSGTVEAYSTLTGGTVSIGNVSIDVASVAPATNSNTVASVNGELAGTTDFTGLNILSGVTAPHADLQNAIDDIGNNNVLSDANEIMVRNHALVAGTVGTVTIVNKTQQLTTETLVADVTAGVTTLGANDSFGAIVAATDVGAVNGAGDPAATLNSVTVGRNGGAANDVITTGEYLVYIV